MIKKLTSNLSVVISSLLLSLLLTTSAIASKSVFSTFDNQPVEIANYIEKDKWLLVMIWASDCHICNREVHAYVDFHFKHEETKARVLGVSVDGKTKKKAAELFIKRHELNFPNLIGEPNEVASWFEKLTGQNWMGTPTLLIYSPEGDLRVQQIGAIPLELVEKFIQRESDRKTAVAETEKTNKQAK